MLPTLYIVKDLKSGLYLNRNCLNKSPKLYRRISDAKSVITSYIKYYNPNVEFEIIPLLLMEQYDAVIKYPNP